MARVRRTFYTARRRTAKWSPHLIQELMSVGLDSAGQFGSYQLLSKNTSDNTTPTPSVIKVKNFRVSVDTSTAYSTNYVQYLNAYIIFIPEGVSISKETPTQHPEWILAWKSLNEITNTNAQSITLSSRLARNLNSGDAIYLLFTGSISQAANYTFYTTSSYVSRAN